MKTCLIYTLLGLFCFSMSTNAQESKKELKSRIGVYSTFLGGNDVFRFDDLDGDGSYNGDGFYTIGLGYSYCLNNRIELQSGLEYSKYKITSMPAYMGEGAGYSFHKEKFKLLTIPVTANINFGKYVFLNGGILLDFEISKKNSIDKQSGLGAVLGIGAKYDFDSGIFILANPYYKLHTLVPFSSENYHHRSQDYGLKIGAGYIF